MSIKYLLERENWISGGIPAMKSFGLWKGGGCGGGSEEGRIIILFFFPLMAQRRPHNQNINPSNLIFFSFLP